MDRWKPYRIILKLTRRPALPVSGVKMPQSVRKIYRKYRVPGAALATFDESGVMEVYSCGFAGHGEKVEEDTRFRTASVSKHITALGVMRLVQDGIVDPDRDINEYMPFPVRHPGAGNVPITLRMLLSHTAGIHDGAAYNAGLEHGSPLSEILSGDSFTRHLPGEGWEYSNLGAGMIGCVLQGITGMNFDTLMQKVVFDAHGIRASYYPQRLGGKLADAMRVLPRKAACYDSRERLSRPLPNDLPDREHHYALAHGNLCITAGDLAVLGCSLLRPGFLYEDTLRQMRKREADFGARAHNLSMGLATFILKDPAISENTIYGHQGLAYGAVHGIFYDPLKGRGFVSLTAGASEARRGVMTDLNSDLIRELI